MNNTEVKELSPFDALLVRQSDEHVTRFDAQRITDALVRETRLAPEVAQQIAVEVEQQIARSGIRALTAPLIRGLVDARLLERGLIAEYRAHSRLGVPIYDVDRIIQAQAESAQTADEPSLSAPDHASLHGPEGSSLALAAAIKREYAMLSVFSEAVASAHLTGELHLENIDEIDRPTTMISSIDFIKHHGVRLPGGFAGSRPAKRADVLALHLVTYTAALQGYFSEAIAWDSVNFGFAPLLVGLNEREFRQVAQALLFELSAPAIARGGQAVRCDLHFDCDAPPYLRDLEAVGAGGDRSSVTYGAMHEVARAFLRTLLEVYVEGDAEGLPFTGPRPILHVTENFLAPQNIQSNGANRALLDLALRAATKGRLLLAFEREEPGAAFTARYGVSPEKLQRASESRQWRAAVFSSVAINLPRVGFRAESDPARVFALLTELLELAAQASLEKRVFLEKLLARGEAGALAMLAMRPNNEPFLSLSWTAHAICPVGLAELTRVVIGTSLDSSTDAQGEAEKFAGHVVAHLNTEVERLSEKHKVRFVLAESRDSSAPRRLARFDRQSFGAPLLGFAHGDELVATDPVAEIAYTNSAKLPANSPLDNYARLRIEGALQTGQGLGESQGRGLIQGAITELTINELPDTDAPETAPATTDELAALIGYALRQTKVTAVAVRQQVKS